MCRRYLQKYAWTYQNYLLTLPLCLANISFQSMDHLREAIQITNTLFMCKLQTIDFCDDLSQIPWETIITINDPNACWCDYYLKLIFIYKVLNCPIPYNLRSRDTDLVVPKLKTEFKKGDYSYIGALE